MQLHLVASVPIQPSLALARSFKVTPAAPISWEAAAVVVRRVIGNVPATMSPRDAIEKNTTGVQRFVAISAKNICHFRLALDIPLWFARLDLSLSLFLFPYSFSFPIFLLYLYFRSSLPLNTTSELCSRGCKNLKLTDVTFFGFWLWGDNLTGTCDSLFSHHREINSFFRM